MIWSPGRAELILDCNSEIDKTRNVRAGAGAFSLKTVATAVVNSKQPIAVSRIRSDLKVVDLVWRVIGLFKFQKRLTVVGTAGAIARHLAQESIVRKTRSCLPTIAGEGARARCSSLSSSPGISADAH